MAHGAGPPVVSFAWRPVVSAAAALVVVLTVFSGQYGYHRDELLGEATDRELEQLPEVEARQLRFVDRRPALVEQPLVVLEDEEEWTETTGGVHVGEYRLRASDGAYRWIRDAATARPGDGPDGKASLLDLFDR